MKKDAVRERLDALIQAQGTSYAAVSQLLRRNPTYVQQFIRKGSPRRLHEEDRRLLAEFFGVDENELGGGVQPSGKAAQSSPRGPQASVHDRTTAYRGGSRRSNGLQRIRRLDVGASAGPGALAEDDRALGAFGFDEAWLKQLGVPADQLSLIRVEGDSMEPTLGDGDDILVASIDAVGHYGAARLREGIYVLRLDGTLLVKRLAFRPDGRLAVSSDNSAYPGFPDVAPEDIDILGRVIWAGRRL